MPRRAAPLHREKNRAMATLLRRPKSPAKQNPRIQRAGIRSPGILSQASRARANPNPQNRSQAAQKALLRREVRRKSRTNRNFIVSVHADTRENRDPASDF